MTAFTESLALLELEASAHAEVLLLADAHVIGEPVTLTQVRYPRLPRVRLLATCRRAELTYEVSLADVRASLAAIEVGKTWREMETAS